jgi:hypothetical protein
MNINPFEDGPPSLTVSGSPSEDIYCRCVAHNCYFNPSPYPVNELKTVFDYLNRTSASSKSCTGTAPGNIIDGDSTKGCLQVNQTSTLFGNYVAVGYVARGTAHCACPEGSILSASIVNGDSVRGATIDSGMPFQSNSDTGDVGLVLHSLHTPILQEQTPTQVTIQASTSAALVNYPGIGYCVDSSLEKEIMFDRPVSALPVQAKTSIQIPTAGTSRRLAVAACCREGEFGQEPADCTATPMVNLVKDEELLTVYSIEAFHAEWLERDSPAHPCVLVETTEENQICIGDKADQLCVKGDTILVCRPSASTVGMMELGCQRSHMMVYNNFAAEQGQISKGYQMRSPQGYQNALVQSLGCIEGNLQYSRFRWKGCSESSHMALTNDDGSSPGPPVSESTGSTGGVESGTGSTASGGSNGGAVSGGSTSDGDNVANDPQPPSGGTDTDTNTNTVTGTGGDGQGTDGGSTGSNNSNNPTTGNDILNNMADRDKPVGTGSDATDEAIQNSDTDASGSSMRVLATSRIAAVVAIALLHLF